MMIKIFGVSVWIHSIFILILGVLLLFHLTKVDVKEPYLAATGSGSAGSGSAGSGSAGSGKSVAYNLTNCVPGSTNTLGSGLVLNDYAIGTYSVNDCPILNIQMNTLKEQAQAYLASFQSTSLQDVQAHLCSLNISYLQTGCNATNSTLTSGSQLINSSLGSYLGSSTSGPLFTPDNIITGTMPLNVNQIVTSAPVPATLRVGSQIYLGQYPTNFIGEFLITNITTGSAASVITTYSTNTKGAMTNAPIFWSTPLGRSNTPVLRSASRQTVNAEIYNQHRYIYLQDKDLHFPTGIYVGSPLYIANCSTTVGPYVAAADPKVDRILIGQYASSGGRPLAADGTFAEPDLLNAFIYSPIFPRPIVLAIKEVFYAGLNGLTASSACAKIGASVATPAQFTVAQANGLQSRSGLAYCWGNKPPQASSIGAYAFNSQSYNDKVGVPYVAGNDVSCRLGTFSYNGDCFLCPAGHYCPAGATNPSQCPINTYNSTAGMSSLSACIMCPAGRVCPVATDVPIPCPAGFYCEAGKLLAACPAGKYNSNTGGTSLANCLDCPAGSYCPVGPPSNYGCSLPYSGASTKVTCPPGATCPVNSTNYQLCPVGTYKSTTGGGSIVYCTPCNPGTYSLPGATSLTQCISCPAGSYCPGGADKTACPAGTYNAATGATSLTQCNLCPAGTYNVSTGSISNTACIYCPDGSYSTAIGATSSTTCSLCPVGTYSVPIISSTYNPTYTNSWGTFVNYTITVTDITRDTSKCNQCPVGTYSAATGATSSTTCSACPAGSYSAAASSACTSCPAGSYSTATGATSSTTCTTCAPGTYSIATGGTSATSCIICPIGKYCPTRDASPVECPAGTYNAATGATTCSPCPANTYSTAAAATSSTTCQPCPAGTRSAPGAFTCTICPAGYYMESGTCTVCPVGYYCLGISEKVACPAGTYNTATGTMSSASCIACAPGTYSSTPGTSSSTTCTACAPGTYSTATGASSSTTCTACAPGTYSTATGASSSATCAYCSAGTYSSTPGASSPATCITCAPGTYSTTPGTTSCTACTPGTYSTATGATSSATCAYCPAGTYSSTSGATSSATCLLCPAGSYSDNIGRAACTACAPGTYSTATGASSSTTCTACAPGTYNSSSGATSSATCSACGPGTYSAAGAGTCTYCPINTYSTATGATSSTTCSSSCPPGYYCPININIATPCPAGTYNSLSNQKTATACLACTTLNPTTTQDTPYCPPASMTNQNKCPVHYVCAQNGAWAVACLNPSNPANPTVLSFCANNAKFGWGIAGINAIGSIPNAYFSWPYTSATVAYIQTPTLPLI